MLLLQVSAAPLFGRPDVRDLPDERRSPPESALSRNSALAQDSPDERRSPPGFALSQNSARARDSPDERRLPPVSVSSQNSARARDSPDARRSPTEFALSQNSARVQPFVRSESVLFRRSDRLGQCFAFLPLGTPFLRPAIQAGFGRSFDRCYDYVKHRERGKRGRHYALNYSGEGVSLLYLLGV